MISKENYEIWMIDYLDGNLSEENQALFLHFLEEHQELKSELEGLDNTILCPDNTISFNKVDLLKTEADEMELPYAEYIAIKEVEEGLDEEELLWKNIYIRENINNNKLFEDYKNTILKIIQSISYPAKNTLKRVKMAPYLTIRSFKQISIAATIAILISIGSWAVLKQNTTRMPISAFNDKSTLPENLEEITAYREIAQIKEGNKSIPKINSTDKQKSIISQNKQISNVPHVKVKPVFERDTIQLLANSAPIHKLQVEKVNAYEVGLNKMMPILISNNLQNKEEKEIAMREHISQESQRLERQARFLSKGAKVLNFLSGNNTTVRRVTNEEGELIAYQVESDNLSVSKKIKNIPVTN